MLLTLRRAVASPLGVLTVVCAFLALVSPWSINIPQVHSDVSFGFQTPICWPAVLAMLVALLTANPTIRLAAVLVDEIALLGWFGWAMWAATTSQYATVDFPFIGIDLIGPGWFEAALGLIAVAAIAARQYHEQEVRPGREVWLLSLVPGMGLVRLGRTMRGVVWAVLISATVFLASTNSPIAPLFQPVGHFDMPPAPPTRALDWILLGAAPILLAASVFDTFVVRRRRAQAP